MVKDIIKSLDFFASLSDEQITLLSSISFFKSYDENYILHYEKSSQNRLEFLVQGLAKAYKIDKHKNEIFLYYIHKNSLISQVSSVDDEPLYPYSNIAIIEESQILSVDYFKFKECFLDNNILSLELSNEIIKQSKQLQGLIDREFIFDSVSKVAMLLAKDLVMFNRLKRADISLMLHIQPATLSRVLNRLKRNNIIDIDHGKVFILDIDQLKRIYEGSIL